MSNAVFFFMATTAAWAHILHHAGGPREAIMKVVNIQTERDRTPKALASMCSESFHPQLSPVFRLKIFLIADLGLSHFFILSNPRQSSEWKLEA